MSKKPIHITFYLLLLLLWSCSAQKNTGLSRAYHNLTAKYNILFNGSESFKDGLEKIEKQFKDDYSEILPVFNYKSKEVVTIAGMDMDRTIKKSSKLITLHSITAKPKVKKDKPLTPDEREFFSKKEYNAFVDDAYLLMGKAHFYRHEFEAASEIFRRIINDFKNRSTVYESRIWLARVAIETGKGIEAADILSSLVNDEAFPEKYLADLYTTYTDYNLQLKNYPEALKFLEKTLEIEKKKKTRTRYLFIMAQLSGKTGDLKRSSDYYREVIKMNPVYDMAFNAQINRALAYEQGFGRAAEIENELTRMLNDDKNIEYQDQIYYALGNLSIKEGNENKALDYYKKSLEANKGNDQQKIRSYLTLANHYYAVHDYPHAQAYYDSVVSNIDPNYPGYSVLMSKSKSLTKLVNEINTVTLGDSVLLLAKLPREELYRRIDAIIAAERKKEDEERNREQEQRKDEQFGQEVAMRNVARQPASGTGSAQWYFYNDAARNLGYREFRQKWGNRRLEDHWQRASKAMVTFAPGTTEEIAEANGISENAQKASGRMSREFYLSEIPFTDSAADATLKNIEVALYNMGLIYKDDLKDYNKADESFKSLTGRYPESSYLLSAYYNLYIIAREQNNPAMMEYYKNIIAGRFPESMYAKVLTDPEYFAGLERKDKAVRDYYEQTYALYQSGNYAEVIERTLNARKSYPDHKLAPQFAYLGILAEGKTADRKVFRDSLIAMAARYPNTDIASDAQNLISYMDKEHPEMKEAEEVKISQQLYHYSPVSRHHFILALDKKVNTNQIIFNIINYNLDHSDSLNLIVEVINIDNRQNLISVKTFRNREQAAKYMSAIIVSDEIRKDIPEFNPVPFVISDRNLTTLRADKSVDRYMKFYNENYR